MKKPKTAAISVRLDEDLKARLLTAAQKLDLSENDISRHAIRAAVNAIEENNFTICLPLQMQVKGGPVESKPALGTTAKLRKERRLGPDHTSLHGPNETPGDYGKNPRK